MKAGSWIRSGVPASRQLVTAGSVLEMQRRTILDLQAQVTSSQRWGREIEHAHVETSELFESLHAATDTIDSLMLVQANTRDQLESTRSRLEVASRPALQVRGAVERRTRAFPQARDELEQNRESTDAILPASSLRTAMVCSRRNY